MKETIMIIMLAILSLLLGGLFLKVEEIRESIPITTHKLLNNSIRDAISEEFKLQEWKGNVFTNF